MSKSSGGSSPRPEELLKAEEKSYSLSKELGSRLQASDEAKLSVARRGGRGDGLLTSPRWMGGSRAPRAPRPHKPKGPKGRAFKRQKVAVLSTTTDERGEVEEKVKQAGAGPGKAPAQPATFIEKLKADPAFDDSYVYCSKTAHEYRETQLPASCLTLLTLFLPSFAFSLLPSFAASVAPSLYSSLRSLPLPRRHRMLYKDSFLYLKPVDQNIYDLQIIKHSEVDKSEYFTLSPAGITHFHGGEADFTTLEQYEREVSESWCKILLHRSCPWDSNAHSTDPMAATYFVNIIVFSVRKDHAALLFPKVPQVETIQGVEQDRPCCAY